MRTRTVQIVSLLLCAALVFASSAFTSPINEGRRSLNMVGAENPQENAPPEYAFVIQAFGAFRSLITNVAFIRAENYKMQGRYYDAYQLASWICKLQPRFPSVWEFQSWNMAWNISVTTYTPEERWNWVYNGAKLIRDEGLRYNPRAINLYKQLAWIFVNKMSESTDEYHMVYKRNWAWRMHLVLGLPPDPLGDYRPGETFEMLEEQIGTDALADATALESRRRAESRGNADRIEDIIADATKKVQSGPLTPSEIVRRAAHDRVKKIADAPDTLKQLYKQVPATREMVKSLRELGIFINDDVLVESDYDKGLALSFFYRYRVLSDPPSLLARVLTDPESDVSASEIERLDQILGFSDENPDGQQLVRFLQKKVLRDVYKMKADRMAELMALFGPMDWRLVDAVALYWVNEGLIAGKETISKFTNDKINTSRMIFFSLRNLFNRNRMVFEPYTADVNYSYINFSPDLNFIEPMHEAFLTYGRMLDPPGPRGGTGETFKTAHTNFLLEAIRMLFFADRILEASHYYEYVRDTYGMQSNGEPNPQYGKPLERFVMDSFRENMSNYRDIRTAMNSLIGAAYSRLADGDLGRSRELMLFSHELYKNYSKDKTEDKLRLPPFKTMQADVLMGTFREPAMNPTVVLIKARLWRRLPPDLRLEVYDNVVSAWRTECDAAGFDLDKAFPPPPGLEEYRKQRGRRGPEKKDDGVETPAQQIN